MVSPGIQRLVERRPVCSQVPEALRRSDRKDGIHIVLELIPGLQFAADLVHHAGRSI